MPREPAISDAPIPAKRPSRAREIIQGLITLIVVVLVFGFVIPKLADYRTVLDYISTISVGSWVLLGLVAALVLVAYMLVLQSALRSLRFGEAYVAQTSAQAVNNTLPAGGAIALPLQYAIYMSWGFTPESVTAMFLAVGMWDQFFRFGLPVLTLAAAAFSQATAWWMWVVGGGGLVVITVGAVVLRAVFRKEHTARWVGAWLDEIINRMLGWVKRPPVDVTGSLLQFRLNTIDVVSRRWRRISLTTLVNHTAQAGLFVACVRAIGIDAAQIPTVWVIAAFALGRLLVMIPVSPGGLGLVDLGWIGLLTAGWQATAGPADTDLIAAATLLFRALTYLPPIPLGAVSWIVYRVEKRWRGNWRTERRGEWEQVAPT